MTNALYTFIFIPTIWVWLSQDSLDSAKPYETRGGGGNGLSAHISTHLLLFLPSLPSPLRISSVAIWLLFLLYFFYI